MIRVTCRGGMPSAVRRALERAGMSIADPGDIVVVWFDGVNEREDSVDERNIAALSPRDEPILALVPRADLVELALRSGATEVLTNLPPPGELLARCSAMVAYADRWRHRVHGTARKSQRVAEDLARARSLLERLLECSPEPIVTADLRGDVLRLNPSAEALLGYRADETTRHLHTSDIFADPGDASRVLAGLRQGGTGMLDVPEVRLRSRAGEHIPARLIAGDIVDSHGEPEGAFLLFSDLREINALRTRLEEAAERIIENEHKVGIVRDAVNVAHELNQPLTAVMGTIELMQARGDLPPDLPARLNRIYGQLERMAAIVRELGSVTRAQELEGFAGPARTLYKVDGQGA